MKNSDIYRSENDFWKNCIYRSIFDFHISVNISYSILTDICLHIPTKTDKFQSAPERYLVADLAWNFYSELFRQQAFIWFMTHKDDVIGDVIMAKILLNRNRNPLHFVFIFGRVRTCCYGMFLQNYFDKWLWCLKILNWSFWRFD